MVRLIPIELNGKTVWLEDAPEVCTNGHRLRPGRGPCPDCPKMIRLWSCGVRDCDAPTLYDDEHQHTTGTLRA